MPRVLCKDDAVKINFNNGSKILDKNYKNHNSQRGDVDLGQGIKRME